jgi:NAD(P)-dependent dehydrogenase (short-subunit alcohol dehydrogenase family)
VDPPHSAPPPQWAGASIPLNAVAPALIASPMTADLMATDENRAAVVAKQMPQGGRSEPFDVRLVNPERLRLALHFAEEAQRARFDLSATLAHPLPREPTS